MHARSISKVASLQISPAPVSQAGRSRIRR